MKKLARLTFASVLLSFFSSAALAAGVKPESSVLFLDDDHREATINIENTDSNSVLLHSTLQTIPEEPDNKLIITPQLARIEAGKKQQIRVVLKEGVNLTHQTMQRINFVSVPPDDGKKNRARVLIGQNIPVILSPANLPENIAPWRGIKAQCAGKFLSVSNPTNYVVRLTTQLDVLPEDKKLILPKTYILPQENLQLPLPQGTVCGGKSVRLHPVTRFGILTTPYEVKL
ncbi:fimbrial protein [Candidatus Pantoea deserta]|uniref:Fimbrial protein n=1 Tax=Candidatus Pantoea deserta TaxID=1869313 RepID=A0A3N4P8S6_9GAMM|nr:fimbria/pilus chaperone family protein [Pantoea deserta]RPE01227.1 fimbrial protein [Pantoea deserta]